MSVSQSIPMTNISVRKNGKLNESEPVVLIGDKNDKPNLEEELTVQKLAEKTGYSQSHIRFLLRNNKIEGIKVANFWLAKVSAVSEYRSETPK